MMNFARNQARRFQHRMFIYKGLNIFSTFDYILWYSNLFSFFSVYSSAIVIIGRIGGKSDSGQAARATWSP